MSENNGKNIGIKTQDFIKSETCQCKTTNIEFREKKDPWLFRFKKCTTVNNNQHTV